MKTNEIIIEEVLDMCEDWTEAHKEELGLTRGDSGWIDVGYLNDFFNDEDDYTDFEDIEEWERELKTFTVSDLLDNMSEEINAEREWQEDYFARFFLVSYVVNAIEKEHDVWAQDAEAVTEYFEKIGLL